MQSQAQTWLSPIQELLAQCCHGRLQGLPLHPPGDERHSGLQVSHPHQNMSLLLSFSSLPVLRSCCPYHIGIMKYSPVYLNLGVRFLVTKNLSMQISNNYFSDLKYFVVCFPGFTKLADLLLSSGLLLLYNY